MMAHCQSASLCGCPTACLDRVCCCAFKTTKKDAARRHNKFYCIKIWLFFLNFGQILVVENLN
jgi:hypothetical protein